MRPSIPGVVAALATLFVLAAVFARGQSESEYLSSVCLFSQGNCNNNAPGYVGAPGGEGTCNASYSVGSSNCPGGSCTKCWGDFGSSSINICVTQWQLTNRGNQCVFSSGNSGDYDVTCGDVGTTASCDANCNCPSGTDASDQQCTFAGCTGTEPTE